MKYIAFILVSVAVIGLFTGESTPPSPSGNFARVMFAHTGGVK